MKKIIFILFIFIFFVSCDKKKNESKDYEIKYSEYNDGIIINGVTNKNVDNIVIPKRIDGIDKDVTIIEYNAFRDMKNLKSIILPDSIIKIYDNAFYNCYNLESINLNSNIIYLGKKAFYNCKSLNNIELPNIESLEEGLFYNCISLDNIILNEATTTIGDKAFYNCYNLSNIDLSYVLNVGQASFYNCYKLKNIPATLVNINDYAFYNCMSINSVILSEDLEYIGYKAFDKCNNILSFENNSLISDSYINNAEINVIEDSVIVDGLIFKHVSTDYMLVSYIGSETNLVLPDTIKNNKYAINEYAFYNSNCTTLTLNENIIKVNDNAFSYSNIESIIIPNEYNKISALAFNHVNNKLINIDNNIKYLKQDDNDYKYVIGSSLKTKALKINDNSLYILDNAFKNNTSIEKVILGNNILSIGEYAFYYNSKLTNIKFNDNLKEIKRYALSRTQLESIKLPNSVTKLDSYATCNITPLKELYLGTGIDTLYSSIANNTLFERVILYNSVKSISNNSINLSDVNVFFFGTKEEYDSIYIGYNNTTFTNMDNIYFYSKNKPEESGNYFYLDNDEIKIWEI